MAGDSLEDVGYDNYIITTVDPGASMLIATLVFSAFLLALLPCLLSAGNQWKRYKKAHRRQSPAHNEDPFVTGKAATTVSRIKKDDNDADESVSSVHSKASVLTGVNSLLNVILDSSPRGGPNLTRAQMTLMTRDHAIEAEERMGSAMTYENSVKGKDSDAISIGNGSVLERLDHDAVSTHDAVDAPQPGAHHEETIDMYDEKHLGRCCSPSRIAANFDFILAIAEWDYESKRICKLGLPFLTQALMMGFSEAIRVAFIGRLIGTQALSVYIVVDLMVGVTTQVMRGFQDALITMCSQSLGVGNKVLTGQYVQITVVLYMLMYIPLFVFWYYLIDDTILWFGLSETAAEIGHDFAVLYILSELLKGLDESIHALLDCIGCENYSTLFTVGRELFVTLGAFVVGQRESSTIQQIGYVFVAVNGTGLVLNVVIVLWNGWLDPYLEGIIGSFAMKNVQAVKLMVKTITALSLGYLLTNGEWELLTIFAGFLGPAEVSAWGILGALWDALEVATEAIADAAEVRTAFLLGAGQPTKAKLSSYKSLYIGLFVTLLITSALFMAGDQIPIWMTHDQTLQHIVSDLIPLFGIGNIALSLGTMSWTLVGAQGRYRLATSVGFAGSWAVTLPLAFLFSVVYNFDLQAQTAAIVVGYMVSGTLNSFILFQSDWEKLSRRVIENNAGEELEDSDDDSSSSSSSSESSSSESSQDEVKSRSDPTAIYNKSA